MTTTFTQWLWGLVHEEEAAPFERKQYVKNEMEQFVPVHHEELFPYPQL
ncbi:hypothetical protein NDK47_16400 [Brevibacillus ruminantium]|uniref:Uncharacterized protein n=1 Tax=Brevibacillus ruminantium TaxID=2950604 RepID=A0ABY4WAF2_9BACL|nr:hypothetical protein [Brevibacillus ruminantium]USG63749.1 hypothetical protein NDK47_16400 [Brevibacillus ruminantium]